ncbi:TnpV protein [uncultured Oscillibacter sp.]|uniref:TnpV protein n=1 Tax=uncultured Oscillibacter sp. TaxID=876091 RepID=UPI0025E730DE|nr:TnpV protein [uncultured Oscillibacter sp.]
MDMTYHEQDGFMIPDLVMPQQPEVHLGKYAELRRKYLKNHRPVVYANLLTTFKLTEHLAEIEEQALETVNRLTEQMAKAEGVTEELKAKDQMRWVGLMNNFKHSAEEQVLSELIYV